MAAVAAAAFRVGVDSRRQWVADRPAEASAAVDSRDRPVHRAEPEDQTSARAQPPAAGQAARPQGSATSAPAVLGSAPRLASARAVAASVLVP